MAKFGEYVLQVGDDEKGFRNLHELVTEYRDSLFTDTDAYDVMFNDGYQPDDDEERKTSYFDVYDSVFLRTRTAAHLGVLERMIELATKLPVVGVSQARIIPYEKGMITMPEFCPEGFLAVDSQGFDAVKIDDLQRKWMTEKGVSEAVRKYHANLSSAWDEFNLKMLLYRMHRISTRPDLYENWGRVYEIQQRIKKTFGSDRFDGPRGRRLVGLDNAYYIMATGFFRAAGNQWERLSESDFGMMFILSDEEETAFVRKIFERGHTEWE